MTYLRRLSLIVVFTIMHPLASFGDLLPANGAETAPNFAEISVLEDRVRVALEIDFDDVHSFLAPAADGEDPAGNLADRTGKAFEVFADDVVLIPETYHLEVKPRKVRLAALRPSYGPPPQDNRSPEVVYVVLDYRFEQQPAKITFVPPLTPKEKPAATIGVIFDHLGVAVTDYRYLSQPEVFYPNWEDPWFSRFENPNLTRHHKSALMSFVSVEPREVRHEVIFRLRDLEDWASLELGNTSILDAEMMDQVKNQAIQLFSKSNPLTIDGKAVQPASAKVEQLSVGVDGLKLLDAPEQTDRATALLGIVLSYPRNSLPQDLSLSWNLFTKDTEAIPVQISDPAGAVPGQVTRDAPEILWKNYIQNWDDPNTQPVTVATVRSVSVPALSLGLVAFAVILAGLAWKNRAGHWQGWAVGALSICIASGALRSTTIDVDLPNKALQNRDAAVQITEAMISNLAIARLEVQDDKLSEALGAFVTEENLNDIAAETRRGLSVTLPSGATAQIQAIDGLDVESIKPLADGGNQILVRWDALVSGGHWGHMHQRIVSHRAMLTVQHHAGTWELFGLTILEARMKTPPSPVGGNS